MASQFSAMDRAGNEHPFGVRFAGGVDWGTCFQFFADGGMGQAVCFFDEVGNRMSRSQMAEVVMNCQTRFVDPGPSEDEVWAQVAERFGEVFVRRTRQ